METESKTRENESILTPDAHSAYAERQASQDPSVDLFVMHGHKSANAASIPSNNMHTDIYIEEPDDTNSELYRVLYSNRITEAALRIAQELKTPLATILVYSQILLSRDNMDEIARRALEIIFSEAQNASLVTTGLTFFACREKPEKQLVSIQEILQRTIEQRIPKLISSNIGLITKLQPDIPKTMADPYQMQQLFTNIVNNAEQVMLEANGRGTLQIAAYQDGSMIKITFKDDGPGIPQHNLKRIFEPFFSTRNAGLGLGLGLTLCSNIIESHNGTIYALSENGQGASIVIELPILT